MTVSSRGTIAFFTAPSRASGRGALAEGMVYCARCALASFPCVHPYTRFHKSRPVGTNPSLGSSHRPLRLSPSYPHQRRDNHGGLSLQQSNSPTVLSFRCHFRPRREEMPESRTDEMDILRYSIFSTLSGMTIQNKKQSRWIPACAGMTAINHSYKTEISPTLPE